MGIQYSAVPTKKEFKKNFGVGRIRHRSLPEGSMHRISKLLEINDLARQGRRDPGRSSLLFDIETHCDHALRHRKSSGLDGDQQRIDSVKALQHAVRGELCKRMKVRHYSEARLKLERKLDLRAKNHHPEEAKFDDHRKMFYMKLEVRRDYRLTFFNSQICTLDDADELICYDTDGEAGNNHMLEYGGAPFVLSRSFNMYITGQNIIDNGTFNHTSFMAGNDVMSAGTLRCEHGVLKWISAKSGHYQPTTRHMLTLLEFLRTKHIDLRKVDMYRVVTNAPADLSVLGKGEFDGCNAMEFLNKRSFPGPKPHAMFVDAKDIG